LAPPGRRSPPGSAWSDAAKRQRADKARQAEQAASAAARKAAADKKASDNKKASDKKAAEEAEAKSKKGKSKVEHWLEVIKELESMEDPPAEMLDSAKKNRDLARKERDLAKTPGDQLKNVSDRVTKKEAQLEREEKAVQEAQAQLEELQKALQEKKQKVEETRKELEDLKVQKTQLQGANLAQVSTPPNVHLNCSEEAPGEVKQLFQQLNDLLKQAQGSGYLVASPPNVAANASAGHGPADNAAAEVDDEHMEMSDEQLDQAIGDNETLKEMAKTDKGRLSLKSTMQTGFTLVKGKTKHKKSQG